MFRVYTGRFRGLGGTVDFHGFEFRVKDSDLEGPRENTQGAGGGRVEVAEELEGA